MIDKCFGDPQRSHGVHVEHISPGLIVDVSDSLTPGSADPGIVKQEVNGFPVEFRGRCLDTCGISDIQGQDLQLVAVRISQSMQLGAEFGSRQVA
jgi:hypothetical protein